MTAPIRVMIVDDSLVTRRLVEDSLREVPGIEVVGTAANGRVAVAKVVELRPDVITLDVEMPELDGLATLRLLKKSHSQIRVIMFSSLTGSGASATIEALAEGAADYVQKPAGAGGMTATRERIRAELVPKIRALCEHRAQPPVALPTLATPLPARALRVVAIGVSTGGPAALHELLSALPRALAVPVLIVQHMPAAFIGLLAKRLASACPLPVAEATAGTMLAPGRVWIAPGDRHLAIARRGTELVLDLQQGPPECSCRPAVDVLFRSVAAQFGSSALGVVLTGMGQDGLRGSKAIRAAGGTIYVQDAASSVVWGMPGAVARAGLADRIVSLADMSCAIATAVAGPGTSAVPERHRART